MSRLALFVLIIGIVQRANGQACTWTWDTPSDATTLTASVKAEVTLVATVTGVTQTTSHTVSMLQGTTALLVAPAASATALDTPTTNTLTGTTIVQSAPSGGGLRYTIVIAAGQLGTANSGDITIAHSGCVTSGGATSAIALTVQYCTSSYSSVTTDATGNKENGNTVTYTCNSDNTATFIATCGADGAFDPQYQACPCSSAGVKEVALLALVMLCSALSATHLM